MNRKRKPARPEIIRAYGYIRVSTNEQASSGAGLQSQRQQVTAEIIKRGWHLLGIVEDAGLSGTVKPDDRPGLGEALKALDAREADALVALKVDSVSRSLDDFTSLAKRSEQQGWHLITLDLPLDPTTPMGRAMRGMLGVFAQLERDFISQRTAEALAVKREQGIKIGRQCHVPSHIVELITTKREQGMSYRAVCNDLNDAGIPTPRAYELESMGKPVPAGLAWLPMAVRDIAGR